jgi:hypothetical protein
MPSTQYRSEPVADSSDLCWLLLQTGFQSSHDARWDAHGSGATGKHAKARGERRGSASRTKRIGREIHFGARMQHSPVTLTACGRVGLVLHLEYKGKRNLLERQLQICPGQTLPAVS